MTDDPWRCDICGTHHPIQPLARDCERKHADTDDDQETKP